VEVHVAGQRPGGGEPASGSDCCASAGRAVQDCQNDQERSQDRAALHRTISPSHILIRSKYRF
jgi:hypothetical protein